MNGLRPKEKLRWDFITKVAGFRLAVGIEKWCVLVSVVR
jgi:hypothetical protein